MNNKGFNILEFNSGTNSINLKLKFDRDYKYFQGHFDKFKLLPALIQIHLVVELYNKHFKDNFIPLKINNLKFVNPIKPLNEYSLEIKRKSTCIDFCFFNENIINSKGSLEL